MTDKAWQCLIDVICNNQKEVPIECVSEFRKLAKIHKVEDYCDYLRDKTLPDTLLQDPWEWKYLEDLSKVLPDNVQIIVLKGAAARDMDLYPLPALRKSVDLDIFVYGLSKEQEKMEFINHLVKNKKLEVASNWNKILQKENIVLGNHNENLIDIHFELFQVCGNLYKWNTKIKRQERKLQEHILSRSYSYRNLNNIRKMNYEDFFLYNTFNYLKEFPFSSLSLMLDCCLILKNNKTTLEKLEKHARETKQLYLYNIGTFILSQLDENIKAKNINWPEKKLFSINKAQSPDLYGLRSLITDRLSKYLLITNCNWPVSIFLGLLHIIKYNVILSSIEENPFTQKSISNFITKILYTCSKFKNRLKKLCLQAAGTYSRQDNNPNIVTTEKKLISVQLEDLKLTFSAPIEFHNNLNRIWKGFLTDDHSNNKIEVEKITAEETKYTNLELTYSNNLIYLESANGLQGKANFSSLGTIHANNFWDVRSFALCLFRAMTFERKDLLLVHAGAANIKSEGIIFPGESSTGKSTFFNLLTRFGANGINDDTVLLKKEDNIWYVYPTPFMSKNTEPIICEKSKLTRIIELIKVCGGHEISQIETDYSLALLMHNSLGGFTIDDNGYLTSKIAEKTLDISKQIKSSAKIKYSLEDKDILYKLINDWLSNPDKILKHRSDLKRVIEFRGISMEPTLKHGDILLTDEIYPGDLKVRDIIGFRNGSSEMPTIHRIMYLIRHKDQTTIITKGDNCIYDDSPNTFKANKKLLKIVKKFDISKNISLTQHQY